MSLPTTFKAAVLSGPNKPMEIQDVELRLPGPGEVLLKVLACGVCHSDVALQDNQLPNSWPVIPGHEVVGDIVAIGQGVIGYKVGDRVGGGWHGGHDFTCSSCLLGQFQLCTNLAINGVTRNGGFAEYCNLRVEAAVPISREVEPAEVAPALCSGVTVFNGIRKMGVEQGKLVAIQGLGGLGHLAVQFSRAMGYRTVAISRGEDKRSLAMSLGAVEYIDSQKEDVNSRLQAMGGAALTVATAPNPEAVGQLLHTLQVRGKLLVLTPIGPIPLDSVSMVNKALSVHGWPSGHVVDKVEVLEFMRVSRVKCLIEKMSLADADQALNEVREGKPRFKKVLVMA